jgi:SAM-dependent MidA family methyltransferase
MGAGGGELLAALRALDPSLELIGVDLADRPPGLPGDVSWQHEVPARSGALLVANEWLDDVPVDVVELADDGWRLVLVDPATGAERLGPPPAVDDADWLAMWWPTEDATVGDRAEIGRPRDDAWAATVGALGDGLAVAIDYAHNRTSRPPAGSLTGYRDGRQVPPVPDGRCDVTSHVALDACAAAGIGAGATATLLTTQRTALIALGVRPDSRRTSCPAPTRPATCEHCRGPGRRPSSPTRAGSAASAGCCRRGAQTGTARRSSAADSESQRRWRRVTIRAGG